MLVDVFKTQLCYLRQVDLQSVVDQLQDVTDLVFVRLCDEDLCCFAELFFGANDRILISSLNKWDDDARRIKSDLAGIYELYQHLHCLC